MKKLLNIILFGVSLSMIEYIILLFFFQLESVIKYSIPITKLSGALRGANEISAVRFIFYFGFWVLVMYFLHNKVNIKYPILKFALLNCALYVALSGLMTLIFPFAKEFFKEEFFYYLIIATLISPFILSMIPYANKLIKRI